MNEKQEDKVLFPPDESMELRSLLEERGFRVCDGIPRIHMYFNAHSSQEHIEGRVP
jgi:hypothetical protein